VLSVAWSADGQRALFAGGLSTLALWDIASGCELRRYDTGGVLVYRAVLTSDGNSLFAGTTDNTLYLWHVHTLPELLSTIAEQRYVPELSQAQRNRYRLTSSTAFPAQR
jgi:WD40 repeat protein